MVEAVTLITIAYLLGSIPFGPIFAKLLGSKDLKKVGSGNIGATNAFRAGGVKLGLLTFIFDALKGALAIIIVHNYYGASLGYMATFTGLTTILGHVFPIWLKFKGGKGIATMFGIYLALSPILGMATILVWVLCFAFTRVSFIASITSALYLLAAVLLLKEAPLIILQLSLVALLAYTHRDNFARYISGKEPKI